MIHRFMKGQPQFRSILPWFRSAAKKFVAIKQRSVMYRMVGGEEENFVRGRQDI
jgi:hypothetical protein